MPLQPNQRTYQTGKSVETALHQLVVWGEKVLDQQETALGVFLDIEGAFNYTIAWWIRAPWRVATIRNDLFMRVAVSRVCPQEVALSLLLRCLVDLMARLNRGYVNTQGFADGICLLAVEEMAKYGVGAHAVGLTHCRNLVRRDRFVGLSRQN